MKNLTQTLMAIAAVALLASPVGAAVVFTEDFEAPTAGDDSTLNSYSKGLVPSAWVKANQGYGSGDQGLNNVGNNQVYSFRYTNSGLTSDVGEIGSFNNAVTHTVTFDVSGDDRINDGAPYETFYNVELIAFAAEATRNDCRSTPSGSQVIASTSGHGPGDGSGATVSFQYVPEDPLQYGSYNGYDLGVRFKGTSTSDNIDNVSVDIVPEPASLALLGLAGAFLVNRRRR